MSVQFQVRESTLAQEYPPKRAEQYMELHKISSVAWGRMTREEAERQFSDPSKIQVLALESAKMKAAAGLVDLFCDEKIF